MNAMFYAPAVLFVSSAGLVLGDGMITAQGLSVGLREKNLVLAKVVGKAGLKGLLVTRFVALCCLVILFSILTVWEWVAFSSVFVAVMVCVVARGVPKLKPQVRPDARRLQNLDSTVEESRS